MKPLAKRIIPSLILLTLASQSAGIAAEVIKGNNTNDLNAGASWSGGTAPAAGDVAVWNGTVTGANLVNLGGALSWQGIRIANPGGLVTINHTAATTLTLGSAGIDLSAATQNLTFGTNAGVVLGANQTWNLARGRTLTLGRATTGSGNLNLSATGSSGAAVISWAPSTGYTGQMTVGPDVQIGAATTGSWLGTQAVNLNGGEVWLSANSSVGWGNPFAVTAGTTTSAIVNNATSTGAVRSIILNGVISGGGTGSVLTFRNQGYMPFDGTTGSKGFIITRASTFEGTIRVENTHATYGSFLRIGGANTTTTDGRNLAAGGNNGSLHANANIVLDNARAVMLLMRNDAHAFGSTVSGVGELWVGHSTVADTTTDSQVVTLSGTNTYTGATRLLSGTIKAGSAAALGNGSAVTLSQGTLLDLNGNSLAIGSLAGSTTTGNIALGSSTLTAGGNDGSTTYAGVISGTGGFVKTGTGTLTLTGTSVHTGATTVNGGGLVLNGTLTSNVSLAAGAVLSGTTGASTGSLTTSATSRLLLTGGAATTALTFTGGVSFTGETWVEFASPGVNSTVYDVVIYGTGGVANLSNLKFPMRGVVANDVSNQKVTFTPGTVTRTWNATSGIWDAAGMQANWLEDDHLYQQFDQVVFGEIAGDATVTLEGILTPSSVVIQNSANTLTLGGDGLISGGTTVAKSGAGTLVIASSNTFSGAVTVGGGILRLDHPAALGTTAGGVTVATGGTLDINGLAVGTEPLTLNGGVLASNYDSIGSWAGTVALSAGSSQVSCAYPITLGGVISGSGNFEKSGPSTLTLTAASTYTGTTTVLSGTLVIGGSVAAQTGVIADASAIDIAPGAALQFTRSTSDTAVANAVSGAGTIVKNGANEIGFTGTCSFSGLIDIQQGKIGLTGADSENGKPAVNIAGGAFFSVGTGFDSGVCTIGNLTGSGQVNTAFGGSNAIRTLEVNQATDATFSGTLVDATGGRILAFRKAGPATLTLTGANTYIGATTVAQGTLAMNSRSAPTMDVTVADGAALDVANSGSQFIIHDLTLGTSGTLTLALRDVSATTGTPLVNCQNLVTNGTTNLNLAGYFPVGSHPLIQYTTRTGAGGIAVGSLPAGVSGTITDTGTSINLVVDTFSPLTWNGGNDDLWDINTSANWKLDATTGLKFINGNVVRFDGTAPGTSVALNDFVMPTAAVFDINLPITFKLGGAGAIDGPATLVKSGTGTLAIFTANTFTGPVTISGGILRMENAAALGTTAGGTTIATGGTLDTNGLAIGTEALTLTGGSIGNSFDATATCSGPLNFASGTSKIGGTYPITLSGLVTGTGGFEKVGAGAVTCTAVSLGYTGPITVGEGTMILSFPGAGGLRNAPITIAGGATLAVASINALQYQATDVLVKSGGTLFLNAGVTSNIGNNSGSFTMQGGSTLGSAPDTDLTWGSWSINTPAATVNVAGGSPLPATISAIWVTTGTLLNLNVTNVTADANPDLIISGSLGRPGNTMGLAISGGGTVFINNPGNLYPGTTTVGGNSTLGGTGRVTGALVIESGSTLAPGTSAGSFSSGAATFAEGSSFAWEIADWNGTTAGTDWDLLAAASLAFNNTAANKLIVRIGGAVANFTETNRTFTIATVTGSIIGFDPASISIDKAAFPGAGTWAVKATATAIQLVYTAGGGGDYGTWASAIPGFTNSAPEQDHDKDGHTNFQEYAFGLNPTSGASVSAVTLPNRIAGTFNYTRRKPSLTGLTYTYEASTTLGGWNPVTPTAVSSNSGDPVETITVTVPAALLTEPTLFLRVKAAQP